LAKRPHAFSVLAFVGGEPGEFDPAHGRMMFWISPL
jgi:hypothetical protein